MAEPINPWTKVIMLNLSCMSKTMEVLLPMVSGEVLEAVGTSGFTPHECTDLSSLARCIEEDLELLLDGVEKLRGCLDACQTPEIDPQPVTVVKAEPPASEAAKAPVAQVLFCGSNPLSSKEAGRVRTGVMIRMPPVTHKLVVVDKPAPAIAKPPRQYASKMTNRTPFPRARKDE